MGERRLKDESGSSVIEFGREKAGGMKGGDHSADSEKRRRGKSREYKV